MEQNKLFDADTARLFKRRPGGSRHFAYKDANGSVCLWCQGSSPGGGASVNIDALDWLREQDGDKFVRVSNEYSDFDEIVPLDELPEKPIKEGRGGKYMFVDPYDFKVPDFSPVEPPF